VTDQQSEPSEPYAPAAVEASTSQSTDEIISGPGEAGTKTKKNTKKNRGAFIGIVGLVYAVLAGGTAAAVVAIASPAPVHVTALGGSSATASGTAGAAGSGSAGSAGAALPTSTGPVTFAAPVPTSTVTGSVHDGVHSGDLRYFLLPAPQGPSSVEGNPDGTTETLANIVSEYGGGYTKQNLSQLDFTGACTRTYQDSTLGANVTIELLQFSTHSDAQEWLNLLSKPSGTTSVSIPGETGSIGWLQSGNGSYQLNGTYVEGDTFFSVAVFGIQEIGTGSLVTLMNSQYSRLANG